MSSFFPMRPYPWQGNVWSGLVARAEQGRVPHALLLSGAAGLGKRQLAAAFAQYLLCDARAPEGACGTCRSCRLFEAGSHPDFVRVEPEEEGKELTVGQVRGVASYQALKAQYSAHKVVLVTPAERMNMNASNALLKTLEEPTPGTLLMLVSDRPSGLLPTIRSRCQAVTLTAPIADAALLGWLQAQSGLAPDAITSLLALTGGAPLRALQLAEEGTGARDAVWTGLAQTAQGTSAVSAVAANWQELGADKAFLWAHAALCDVVRVRSAGEAFILNAGEPAARLHALAKPIDLKSLFRLIDRVQEAGRLLRGHVNAQLLIEEVLIHWTTLFQRRAPGR